MSFKNIVNAEWLQEHLEDPDLVIIDCQFQLGDPEKGWETYKQEHFPKAVYLHLEKDLSAPISKHGGRHPLPAIEEMVETFSRVGINSKKKVVAYDDQGGAMASRLWWMLKFLGHENVVILREGLSGWKKKGFVTTSNIIRPERATFTADVKKEMVVTMEEVKSSLDDKNVVLIDSRSEERFTGEKEAIDAVAGHIPGAVVENWQNRLTSDGQWKAKTEQEKDLLKYKNGGKQLIVYCGSGVTACTNILALDELQLKSKLYAGSWSDWITYKDNPIETGNL